MAEEFHLTRVYRAPWHNSFRTKTARWIAKRNDADVWEVSFSGDNVPRTNWLAENDADFFAKVEIEHNAWVAFFNQRQEDS